MSAATVSSPPPSARPTQTPAPDARDRLHQLANTLTAARDVKLLREYLRLRAAIRL